MGVARAAARAISCARDATSRDRPRDRARHVARTPAALRSSPLAHSTRENGPPWPPEPAAARPTMEATVFVGARPGVRALINAARARSRTPRPDARRARPRPVPLQACSSAATERPRTRLGVPGHARAAARPTRVGAGPGGTDRFRRDGGHRARGNRRDRSGPGFPVWRDRRAEDRVPHDTRLSGHEAEPSSSRVGARTRRGLIVAANPLVDEPDKRRVVDASVVACGAARSARDPVPAMTMTTAWKYRSAPWLRAGVQPHARSRLRT